MTDVGEDAITGCLLGTAVGDAIGLPCEAMTRARQRRLFGKIDGPRLLWGRGMVSDDTEHACLTAQALIISAGDTALFRRELARQLRGWLLTLPAGTGMATLKACVRLWFGVNPQRSGVYSAGNGPAIRAPIIGICCGNDTGVLRELVRASTHLTHTDPKAEYGAFAIALAAHWSRTKTEIIPYEYCHELQRLLPDEADELKQLINKAVASVDAGENTEQFADSLGLGYGFSGYIYHTVPGVLHAWFRHPEDYRAAVLEIVSCGGDTDSTAAILGGIIGSRLGRSGIPHEWLGALWEWPRSVHWMQKLGQRLAGVLARSTPQPALPLPFAGVVLRNFVFLLIVLGHGFRRLLPPY